VSVFEILITTAHCRAEWGDVNSSVEPLLTVSCVDALDLFLLRACFSAFASQIIRDDCLMVVPLYNHAFVYPMTDVRHVDEHPLQTAVGWCEAAGVF